MQNIASKALMGFFALCLLIVAGAFYDSHWSPEAQQGFRNQENIKQIKRGMTTAQVTALLGAPTRRNQILDFPEKLSYSYQTPPGTLLACDVEFDSTNSVSDIHYGNQ